MPKRSAEVRLREQTAWWKDPERSYETRRAIAMRAIRAGEVSPRLVADLMGIRRDTVTAWFRRYPDPADA